MPRPRRHDDHDPLRVRVRVRVLLARDGSFVGPDVARLLTAAGFDVVGQADDAERAVVMAIDLHPDVTVMHLADGLAAATAIHLGRLGPVVLMADGIGPDLINGAVQAGVMTCVPTPVTGRRLIPAIEMAMARHADTNALRTEIADLGERLDSRKTVERAKGLLMTRRQMTEQEAFRFLQRTAMNHRTSLRSVAATVVGRLSAA
jgi:response regulator NasT